MTSNERHQPKFLEWLPAYVLGSLDPAELSELERHLATDCAECNAELRQWSVELEALALTTEPVVPSASAREAVLAAAAPTPFVPRVERRAPRWLALAASLLLALAGFSAWRAVELSGRTAELARENERLAAELSALGDELRASSRSLDRLRRINRIISSRYASSVQLAGLDEAPQAFGVSYVDSQSKAAAVYMSNLEPVPEAKTYQLWLIASGTPVSAGTFEVDADGSALALVELEVEPSEIQLWAVTIEAAGGSPQPTGPMVLKG